MHSHDQSLLAKMGFNDPDKKDARHDLACRYIFVKNVISKIIESLYKKFFRKQPVADGGKPVSEGEVGFEKAVDFHGIGQVEFHLQKGKDQYATTDYRIYRRIYDTRNRCRYYKR